MSREHTVYLFTTQPACDFENNSGPHFPDNVVIVSSYGDQGYRSILSKLPDRLSDALHFRILRRQFSGISNSYFLKGYPTLLKTLRYVKPDIVYYENLESMVLFSAFVKKGLPAARQIYDAHNVDSNLWRQLANAQNNTEYNTYFKTALKNEKQLYKMVNAVFCCSKPDQQIFINLNNCLVNSCVIPNGVDTFEKHFDPNPDKYLSLEILFCGGLDYYPNQEGIRWFYDKVFPLVQSSIPGIRLILVGKAPLIQKSISVEQDPSVEIIGMVTDVKPFYNRASVCIAPLLSGSGTRLKILEAMSMGNPVVATSIGAEGIAYADGENILIADSPEIFAVQIIKLLSDKALFENLRFEAWKMVNERYEWSKIGLQVNESIEKLLILPNAS